jgi:hypothetical protein
MAGAQLGVKLDLVRADAQDKEGWGCTRSAGGGDKNQTRAAR